MDSTNRLHLFSHQIQQRFISAGFENFSRRGRDGKYDDNFLRFKIFNAWKVRASRRVVDEHRHEVQERRYPDFDALGLIEKYKDVVLAEGIPLEKISLCKNGRKAKFQGSRNQIWVTNTMRKWVAFPCLRRHDLKGTLSLRNTIPLITTWFRMSPSLVALT